MSRSFNYLLFLFLFFGCSSIGFFYDYAPSYIKWELDSYFDITSEQEEWVDQKIKTHFDWHRNKELPLFVKFFKEIQKKGGDGLTLDEVQEGYIRSQFLWKNIIDHLLEDVSFFLNMLKPYQVDHLEEYFKEKNHERKDSVSDTPEERKEERFVKFSNTLEEWFGHFSNPQQQKLRILYNQWNEDAQNDHTFEESIRRERQKKFVKFLRSKHTLEESKKWLSHWFRFWTEPSDHKSIKERKIKIERNINRILDVDTILNLEQRKNAVKKIQIWIERINAAISNQ